MLPTPPSVETGRLILRPHRRDDLEACTALWNDPSVMRFITRRPASREEAWARILRYLGHWSLMGFGFWALEEKASRRLIGEIGIADF